MICLLIVFSQSPLCNGSKHGRNQCEYKQHLFVVYPKDCRFSSSVDSGLVSGLVNGTDTDAMRGRDKYGENRREKQKAADSASTLRNSGWSRNATSMNMPQMPRSTAPVGI